MKTCVNCFREFEDYASFCPFCGTSENGEKEFNKEKELVNHFHRFLRYERTAWKINGIVFLVLAGLFALLDFIFILAGIGLLADGDDEGAMLIGMGVVYLLYVVIFGAPAIVSLKAMKRTEYYINSVYTDVRPTVDRCGSVGMIVFNAIFNSIALIFFIVNFVRVKSDSDIIQRIIARQSAAAAPAQASVQNPAENSGEAFS